jgi:hypothetical protein
MTRYQCHNRLKRLKHAKNDLPESADLILPFTRATASATFPSPQQLQGEFVTSFHRFAASTGSLQKRQLTTTPLHSFFEFAK